MVRRTRRHLLTPVLGLGLLALVTVGCVGPAAFAFGSEPAPTAESFEERVIEELLPQMENHTAPDKPLFSGEFAPPGLEASRTLLVVTYNLRYGEAVPETIRAYREIQPLPAADIILLQEMDEAGTQAIARELGYNFVYYPASVAEDGDNFGNAILARWPIADPAKIILPGLHPLTGQQRTATRAVVRAGQTDILVYSTHIEIALAPPSLREAQFAAILADIPADAPFVIVGGDFNTVTERGVDRLAEQFAASDLTHHTDGLGPTFTRLGIESSATDHLFSRGFDRLEAGVLRDISASDHFPVWARLALP